MKYVSTRSPSQEKKTFRDVLLTGLAPDGGLYIPDKIPQFSKQEMKHLQTVDYPQLAFSIIQHFIGDDINQSDLQKLIDNSYSIGSIYRHKAIAPLYQLGNNQWLLELFHGPTFAFKDFALQLLGRLLDHYLTEQDEQAIVIGATSGDTGSAAIEGCRHSDRLNNFIVHPYQRVSEIQRRQMTTVQAKNVHNIALKGNFDDCQSLIKACFKNQDFLPKKTRLVAVNSINWARIMAQVVYYFYAALSLGAPDKSVSFSVPTGNFGDIFAGYIAKKMGLPIDKLIIATNQNDILHRFINSNDYTKRPLQQSLSPSMDILISSNFERLLFDIVDRDANQVQQLMTNFQTTGQLNIPQKAWQDIQSLFMSHASNDQATLQTMKNVYQDCQYLLDPHTATAVNAINQLALDKKSPVIALATAHPIKFSDAVKMANLKPPKMPDNLAQMMLSEEKYTILDNNLQSLQNFIIRNH